jgi:hypothetical protein
MRTPMTNGLEKVFGRSAQREVLRTASTCQISEEIPYSVGATPERSGRECPLGKTGCNASVIVVALTSDVPVRVAEEGRMTYPTPSPLLHQALPPSSANLFTRALARDREVEGTASRIIRNLQDRRWQPKDGGGNISRTHVQPPPSWRTRISPPFVDFISVTYSIAHPPG